jgi:hypothetical protein
MTLIKRRTRENANPGGEKHVIIETAFLLRARNDWEG